ncbi:MAG: TlpA family protein disulfide reductase [Anaerolineaceae bacterium]|nr:TlpA family protein disulfide reductase [Anaerolineaceae bacterium]
MKNKRWYLDAALILIVLFLGALLVLRLTNYAKPEAEVQTTEETAAPEGVANVEVVVDPTSTPVVLTADEQEPEDVDYAIDFTLNDLAGNSVSLSDYAGTPVLVNFWATWCPPCRSELPLIQAYQEKYADGFVVLALSGGETAQDVQAFITENGYTFMVLLDSDYAISELYGVRGYPTSFFIDADGVIQKVHIGELTEPLIMAYLDQIGISE